LSVPPALRDAGPFVGPFCLAMPRQTNYHDAVGNCHYYSVLERAVILEILGFIDDMALVRLAP
jgi:hypothetical protein